ncbi:Dak1 domain-containing protein [Phycomyces nitens]|nr:Dak1 domain-containing protein [Phycomyces nitens]
MAYTQYPKKHLLNSPNTLVTESLQGLCCAHPHLRLDSSYNVIYRQDVDEIASTRVTLIAGGGSGHEPAHAASVGEGMLTAAVCGNVFASPSSAQVLAAIERVQSPHGTLVIVMNYTGDCLNFGLAVERAKAKGIKVTMIIVDDDVSVGRTKGAKVGRRGLAATTLVIKLAGAMASKGACLEQVSEAGALCIKNAATLGVALDHCHVPGSSGDSHVSLGPDEVELGVGIHNEPGFLKTPLGSVGSLVGTMMDILIDQNDPERSYLSLPLKSKTKIVLFVNNLGGTSMLEFNGAVKAAVDYILTKPHLSLERVFAGPFLTSLNMPGFSLTLLRIVDNKMLDWLDYPVKVAGWSLAPAHTFSATYESPVLPRVANKPAPFKIPQSNPELVKAAILAAARAVIEAEPEITSLDTILGDGDCGHTLKAAATAIIQTLPSLDLQSAPDTIIGLADAIERTAGGTSSAIYCIFLNALAAGLQQSPIPTDGRVLWATAARHALIILEQYTLARVGDRTLMDVLTPFVDTLGAKDKTVDDAIKAAQKGAESTRKMPAKMGRASYLATEDVLTAGLPDAGAWGLAALLRGLGQALDSKP